MTPSRAFFTRGVSVLIFMPGPAGMAHEATGLGLFSTCGSAHGRRIGAHDVVECGWEMREVHGCSVAGARCA